MGYGGKMRKIILSLLLTCLIITLGAQEWNLDFDEAIRKAKEQDKNMLLVFQGSDWCVPCMKLEKNIWESDEFIKYSQENLVLLKADFPRKKSNKLSQAQMDKNEILFEKYNTPGSFPFILVFDNSGNILGSTGYKDVTPQEYIAHLNTF